MEIVGITQWAGELQTRNNAFGELMKERFDVSKSASASPKLSEKFAGSLSKESVHKMQQELNSMRNEWK